MDHEYRGIAVIINNDIFEGTAQSSSERSGSLKDINDLQNIFFQMDFEVLIWNNLYNEELTDRLAKCMYLIKMKYIMFIYLLLFLFLQWLKKIILKTIALWLLS